MVNSSVVNSNMQPRVKSRIGFCNGMPGASSSTQSKKITLTQEKIYEIKFKLMDNNLRDIVNLIDENKKNPSTDDRYLCLDYVIEIFDENNQTTDQQARSHKMAIEEKQNFVRFVMKHEFDLGEFDMDCSYSLLGIRDLGDKEIIEKVNEYSSETEFVVKNQYYPSRHSKVKTLVEAFTGKNLGGKETSCPCTMPLFSCSPGNLLLRASEDAAIPVNSSPEAPGGAANEESTIPVNPPLGAPEDAAIPVNSSPEAPGDADIPVISSQEAPGGAANEFKLQL
jgi:hypothetical protein